MKTDLANPANWYSPFQDASLGFFSIFFKPLSFDFLMRKVFREVSHTGLLLNESPSLCNISSIFDSLSYSVSFAFLRLMCNTHRQSLSDIVPQGLRGIEVKNHIIVFCLSSYSFLFFFRSTARRKPIRSVYYLSLGSVMNNRNPKISLA